MPPALPILDPDSRKFNRVDAAWLAIWLIFLLGLAVLPPQLEWHKQLILLAIGIVQLLESKLISRFQKRGVFYVILLKILLATLLLDHTEEIGINSSYYPIYYLPVVTAALYCGTWLTLLWTLLASAAFPRSPGPGSISMWIKPSPKTYGCNRNRAPMSRSGMLFAGVVSTVIGLT